MCSRSERRLLSGRQSLRLVSLLVLSLALAACQAQAPVPEALLQQTASAARQSAELGSQVAAQQEQLQSLEGRLTRVQEQVIKSRESLEQLLARSDQGLRALQRLEQLQAMGPQASASDSEPLEQLGQMLERLERLAASSAKTSAGAESGSVETFSAETLSAPFYELISVYTAEDDWVIFRMDRTTGLTWRARDGRWAAIEEPSALPASRYQLVAREAQGDVKGFVAARIDQRSGETWWLKGDRWEVFDY